MRTRYLLPNRYKLIGWLIFIPSIILGLLWTAFEFEPGFLNIKVFALMDESVQYSHYFSFIENNIADELLGILVIISSFFVAFSEEKHEDEYIAQIRLESLTWATYINYIVLIIALVMVYDFAFFWVMVYNMFTILLFFIIRFNWALRKLKKQIGHEE